MRIPGFVKPMLHSIRPVGEDDEPMLETESMKTTRLSKQIQNDRQRSLVQNQQAIKRAEACMRRTQDKVLKAELKQKINRLEKENSETQRFLD